MRDDASYATRLDLAAALARGVGVELGVAEGAFSEALLSGVPGLDRLYSIDRWSDPWHDDEEMLRARRRLARFGERSRVLRATFEEAARQFPDGAFDFIYVDGYAHTGQDGGATLRDWWPKLRAGGVFAGHDYCAAYPQTIAAVDAFARDRGLVINVTGEADYPSWWTVKL